VIKKFIFWAQALDNTSPDHIHVRGEELPPSDAARRQEAVSLVSAVVKFGTRVFNQKGVQLTEDGYHFVVEVPSVERDLAGRTAPIICYGDYDLKVVDVLSSLVSFELDDFANRIGRNILPEHRTLAHRSFRILKKKSSVRKVGRLAMGGAGVLAFLALVGLLLLLLRDLLGK
jgi:hypothetical protein